MNVYQRLLEAQQTRALQLSKDRRCPHCNGALTLWDALAMVRGQGYSYHVTIQLSDGTRVPILERDVNPQTMLLAED
jgi:hypothetical protein